MRRLAVVVVFALAGIPVVFAQPPRNPPVNRREQVKKRIRTLRAMTLTEELKLDPQTAEKVFPILAKYDDETDKRVQERVDIQRRLTTADGKSPKEIDKVIDDAIALQRRFRDLEDHRLDELRKVLTPQQTAKLLVVLPALEKKIQNQLQRAIQNQGKPGGDEDDDGEPDKPPPRKPPVRQQLQ
jgi:hypothetical protein